MNHFARALFLLVSALAVTARAQTEPAPIVIEMANAGDDRSEAAQIAIGELHLEKGVPLSIAVIPCTQETPPGVCTDDGSLQATYRRWTFENPSLIEIGQEGRDNSESLGNLPAAQQRALVEEGYEAIVGRTFGNGAPLFFVPARSSANADTAEIVADLGFQTFAQNTGTCPAMVGDVDRFCGSVRLCTGGTTGPTCSLRPPAQILAEARARAAADPVEAGFVLFNVQDLTAAGGVLDSAKLAEYAAFLDAVVAARDAGEVSPRTFDGHWRVRRGFPPPTPRPVPTATPIPPPSHLPVIFENDDARDGVYEPGTMASIQAHLDTGVPLVQASVPCGGGSRLPPDGFLCTQTAFHDQYVAIAAANPGMLEIAQHGLSHEEELATLSRAEQFDYLSRGLDMMRTWGLPEGRPFTHAAPFASANDDTMRVLEDLGFRVAVKNSGTCNSSPTLEVFCNSVPICELTPQGGRVAGPACVLRDPQELIAEVNSRQNEGKVFLVYHVQDLLLPGLQQLDPAKVDALRAILSAFRDAGDAGHYDLMTMETYWRERRLPTPTATPPVPTATPTRTPTPPTPTATPTRTPTSPGPTPTPPGVLGIVTGAGAGGGPHVVVWRVDEGAVGPHASFLAYDPAFGGGVRVAAHGSLVVTAPGAGGGPHVRIFDVSSGTPVLRRDIFPYDRLFTGGVHVALGRDENDAPFVVTGSGETGGPHVRIFGLANPALPVPLDGPTKGFNPFPTARVDGGARVAACDLDGEPGDEIVAASGPAGEPIVRAVRREPGGTFSDLGAFFPYSRGFRGGVWVACSDIDGDGRAEIVTGAGEGGGPQVRVFELRESGGFAAGESFFAFNPAFGGGVRVGVSHTSPDGHCDVVAAAGPGGGSDVRTFRFHEDGGPMAVAPAFKAYGGFTGGVFVGGFPRP